MDGREWRIQPQKLQRGGAESNKSVNWNVHLLVTLPSLLPSPCFSLLSSHLPTITVESLHEDSDFASDLLRE